MKTTYEIDPAHSSAQFSVRHMMITNVRGGFSSIKGTVVYDAENPSLSTVDATIDPSTIATLDLQRDGNVVLYDTKAVFAANAIHSISSQEKLESGWLLFASGGEYYLDMLSTGDLTLRNDANQLLWHSNTKGTGNYAIMQGDGNLVVYSAANKALWASNTHGAANNGKSADPPGPAASATPCPAPPPPAPPPVPTVTQTVTSIVTTTTATVETVPVPVRPHHVKVKITVKWRYHGPVTRMERLTVGRMPRHAQFTAFYRQSHGHDRRHVRDASTKHDIRSMIHWLESYRYRPGDRCCTRCPGCGARSTTGRSRRRSDPGGRGREPATGRWGRPAWRS